MEPCPCEGCVHLGQVDDALTRIFADLHITDQQDVTIGKRILEDLTALRASIAFKHGLQRHSSAEHDGSINGRKRVGNETLLMPTIFSREERSVCDHCALHGLNCRGSPVCFNCRKCASPCIRRRCGRGTACADFQCHYAHDGVLTITDAQFSLADYIILPGVLPKVTSHGLQTTLDRVALPPDGPLSIDHAKLRQKQALAELFEWAGGDEEKARLLSYPCKDFCKRTFSPQQQNGLSADQLKVKTLADKLLGKSR